MVIDVSRWSLYENNITPLSKYIAWEVERKYIEIRKNTRCKENFIERSNG